MFLKVFHVYTLHVCVNACECVYVCTICSDYCRYSEAITGWNRKNNMALTDIDVCTGAMSGLGRIDKGVLSQGNKRTKAQRQDQGPAGSRGDFVCELIF